MSGDYSSFLSITDWRCPACNTNTNSLGNTFSGLTAVALHVAGKIRTGDSNHKQWASNIVGISIYDPTVNKSINTLADELQQAVLEHNRIRHEQLSAKIRELVEAQLATDEPHVRAYRHIKQLETSLHEFVQDTLQETFVGGNDSWWTDGIPLDIRKKCANRREEDTHREELYMYTDLIDLKSIIEKNWKLFEPKFRRIGTKISKNEFLHDIDKSNDTRRRVMHPIRKDVTKNELTFLKDFYNLVYRLALPRNK
ncbi:MAG: hypothetical protein FJZ85_00575 [Chloroflexi bacterium]|nr:hypothetical protein [Chloroflexota bacterium]